MKLGLPELVRICGHWWWGGGGGRNCGVVRGQRMMTAATQRCRVVLRRQRVVGMHTRVHWRRVRMGVVGWHKAGRRPVVQRRRGHNLGRGHLLHLLQRLLLVRLLEVARVAGVVARYLQFRLDLAQLAPRQHLDVRADLFTRSRLSRPQFDIPKRLDL